MAALDVDEIWADMQNEQRGPGRRLAKAKDLSALQQEKQRPKKPTKKLDASLQWMHSWSVACKPQPDIGKPDSTVEEYSMRMTQPPSTLIDAVEEIPTETPETFLAYIQRDINCLGEDSIHIRLQSLQKLERLLVSQIDTLSTDIVDAVGNAMLKPLLKRMKDKSEKCRELGVRVLRSLVENTSDLSPMLPYAFPTLVSRLGSEDLDGIAHLPEVARPDPEQKPTEIARPVEESEEVRRELATFVASLLTRCNQAQVYSYIDEAAGLLRAQAMDPFHEVKAIACETMIAFCHNHTEMLLHFATPMGRSLMSCLVHNHAKIRIAGLRALTAVLWCGVWKHNHEIVQVLMAWQDPNKVPVKAFYESVTNVNYMSTLSFDRHPMVRRFWYETLAYWLLRIPDKVDHEPYIFPHLLTGLCDENEEIALEVFWLIERCGELYEAEHEGDLRKTRQYGFDYGWTYGGRAFVPFPLRGAWGGGGVADHVRRVAAQGPDLMGQKQLGDHLPRDQLQAGAADPLGEELPVPERDFAWPELRDLAVFRTLPRPRLGSRCWVRTHTRRYIKATFNDVVDFRDCTALNAARLLCMSLAYTEEGVTEWLQPMFVAVCKFYSGRAWAAGDSEVTRTFDTICKLLGTFLDPVSYWHQLRGALDADSVLDFDQRAANLRVLALCIEGSVQALQSVSPPDPDLGMGRLGAVVPELISCMHASDLLLCPTSDSRAALWQLLFSFLEPLRRHLTLGHASQLLYVALALSARAPLEASEELAWKTSVDVPQLDGEGELEDRDKLGRALACLSAGIEPAAESAPKFDLDSLDDDDGATQAAPEQAEGDPRVVHRELFQRAFAEILAHLEDVFQIFQSVVYLSPLSVLSSGEHGDVVLGKLSSFCSTGSSPAIRSASQALGVHLALRCSKLLLAQPCGDASAPAIRAFMWKVFKILGAAQLDGSTGTKSLSYAVILTGLSLWRRFFLDPGVDPRHVLFPPGGGGSPSKPLQWLTSLLADQELYKRFHLALEHAETSHTGRDRDSFVVNKSRQIREQSDQRASNVRALAASTLLLVIRRMLLDGRGGIPWGGASPSGHGSARAVFLGAASVFCAAAPTMDPPFVKQTPPHIVLYAAEIIRVLLHQAPHSAPPPFRLLDDAARAIHHLSAPGSAPVVPFATEVEERETLVVNFVGALTDLNLTLPPDPQAKHAPASLDDAGGGGDIVLGWDEAVTSCSEPGGGGMDPDSSRSARAVRSTAEGPAHSGRQAAAALLPSEVRRLLAQSPECLRWNAALLLYGLGVDLAVVCHDGFQRGLARWKRRKEQAKALIAVDVLQRARATLGGDPELMAAPGADGAAR